ncbi:hypothetical protein [Clostridium argentinense]|nr:hypothetical protein [Clostridium argentinense]
MRYIKLAKSCISVAGYLFYINYEVYKEEERWNLCNSNGSFALTMRYIK